MTIEQALAQLDVAPGLPRMELRRAYLRAVKRHPPERDPDGFQRVREAFELLRAYDADDYAALEADGEAEGPYENGNEAGSTLATPERLAAAAGSEGEAAAETDDPTAEEADLSELDSLPSNATRAQLLEAGRGLLSCAPDSSSLAWEVVSWLEEREHEDLAAKLVREAHERGLPGFLSTLLHRYPEHATDKVIEQAASSQELELRYGALGALIAQGRPSRAFKLAIGLLEQARNDGHSFYAGVYIDLMIELLGAGERKAATELERVFADYMKATGNETEILRDALAARWLLFTEFSSLGTKLPSSLSEALIDVMRGGDPQRAFKVVDHYARYNTSEARRITRLLRERAPSLFALIGSPEINEASGWSDWSKLWPIAVVLMVVLRCAAGLSSPPKTPEKPARTEVALPPAVTTVPDLVTSPDADDILANVHLLRSRAAMRVQTDLEGSAAALEAAWKRNDCTAILNDLAALNKVTDKDVELQPADVALVLAIRAGVRQRCSTEP